MSETNGIPSASIIETFIPSIYLNTIVLFEVFYGIVSLDKSTLFVSLGKISYLLLDQSRYSHIQYAITFIISENIYT